MQGWTRSPYMLAPPAHTSDITRRDGRVLWVVVRSDISSWAYGAQLDACMVVNCFLTCTVAYVPAHPEKLAPVHSTWCGLSPTD